MPYCVRAMKRERIHGSQPGGAVSPMVVSEKGCTALNGPPIPGMRAGDVMISAQPLNNVTAQHSNNRIDAPRKFDDMSGYR
jgi:hypothetical protein